MVYQKSAGSFNQLTHLTVELPFGDASDEYHMHVLCGAIINFIDSLNHNAPKRPKNLNYVGFIVNDFPISHKETHFREMMKKSASSVSEQRGYKKPVITVPVFAVHYYKKASVVVYVQYNDDAIDEIKRNASGPLDGLYLGIETELRWGEGGMTLGGNDKDEEINIWFAAKAKMLKGVVVGRNISRVGVFSGLREMLEKQENTIEHLEFTGSPWVDRYENTVRQDHIAERRSYLATYENTFLVLTNPNCVVNTLVVCYDADKDVNLATTRGLRKLNGRVPTIMVEIDENAGSFNLLIELLHSLKSAECGCENVCVRARIPFRLYGNEPVPQRDRMTSQAADIVCRIAYNTYTPNFDYVPRGMPKDHYGTWLGADMQLYNHNGMVNGDYLKMINDQRQTIYDIIGSAATQRPALISCLPSELIRTVMSFLAPRWEAHAPTGRFRIDDET